MKSVLYLINGIFISSYLVIFMYVLYGVYSSLKKINDAINEQTETQEKSMKVLCEAVLFYNKK